MTGVVLTLEKVTYLEELYLLLIPHHAVTDLEMPTAVGKTLLDVCVCLYARRKSLGQHSFHCSMYMSK